MIYILLPAYEEELALRPMMEKISGVMKEMGAAYRVVVVNDGSRDRTGQISKELSAQYPVDVLTHKYNRGLGETIRDGMEYIAERAAPTDVIVRMDCDDTHEPRYIPLMIDKLNQGNETVITSRYAPGGGEVGLNWYRRMISRCANLLFKVSFPIPGVWEYTCGYRAYRAAIIQDAIAIFGNKFIDLKGMGFTGTLEKLIKLELMGAKITEIPFVLRYDQKFSTSKVVTSLTTLGCFLLILKHRIWWKGEPKKWLEMIEARKARVYSQKLPDVSVGPGPAVISKGKHG
jgi:dolichol-phosphate mannosyltransferase